MVRCQNSFRGRTRLLALTTGGTVHEGGRAKQTKLGRIITQQGETQDVFPDRQRSIEDGYRTVVNVGPRGEPSVFHLHVHLPAGGTCSGLPARNRL